MDRIIKKAEDCLFSAKDTVCLERARLVTQAYLKHEDEPPVIVQARALDNVLSHMSLDLQSNPILAGNTSSAPRAWMLVPEFNMGSELQIAIEHEELKGFLNGKIPEELWDFWRARCVGNTPGGTAGIGHMSVDFDAVVNRGIEAVLETIEAHADQGDANNRAYRQAMLISCQAVIRWTHRYAAAAEKLAASTEDAELRLCYESQAEACRHVPARPARNFFEALQSIVLVHLATVLEGQGMSISIGLPDRALGRFAEEVEADYAQSVQLLRAFLLKIAANSYLGRGSKTQAITIGGQNSTGDACNPITLAFLDAFDKTPVNDPHLFLRWHDSMDKRCWQRATDMLSRGRSMPLLINDAQVLPGLREAAVRETDALDYCIVGCNELGIPGRCCQSGFSMHMGFNELELLHEVLEAFSGARVAISEILEHYHTAIIERTRKGLDRRKQQIAMLVDKRPTPFCSAWCENCAEKGEDLLTGMPYPDIYGVFVRGTSNAINALAAVETLVNRESRFSLEELQTGIQTRDPEVLEAIARCPKWGNDDTLTNRLAEDLNRARDSALRELARELRIPPFAVCHVVRSLHHVDGRRIAQTLDGRDAGAPVGDSIGPVQGTTKQGPTAVLNSVGSLDSAHLFPGIYNLNLTLPISTTPEIVRNLSETFFKNGGQELQFNILDPQRLRVARGEPEKHRDIVVRVAGLNARFVELSDLEQEELIARAEALDG